MKVAYRQDFDLRVSLNASYKRHHSRTLKRDQRSSLRRKVHARPYPLLRGLLKVSSTFAQWHSSEKRANRRRPRRVLQHGSRFLKENQNRPRWAYAWDRTQRRIVVALCTGAKRHRKRQEGKGRNVRIDARRRKRKECTYGCATEGLLEIHCPIWELFHVESVDES